MRDSDDGTTYMRVGGDYGQLRPWHPISAFFLDSESQGSNPICSLQQNVLVSQSTLYTAAERGQPGKAKATCYCSQLEGMFQVSGCRGDFKIET